MTVQTLTLTLEGINPGDYTDWVRDPEPPALGHDLRFVTVRQDPLGDTIEVVLGWEGPPPVPALAAQLAGFPLTPEVVAVEARRLAAAA